MTKKYVLIVSVSVLLVVVITLVFLHSRRNPYADRAQNMIESLKTGDYQNAVADFNPPLKYVVSSQTMGQQWSRLIAKYGPLKQYSIAGMRAENNPYKTDKYGLYIICKFERGTKVLVLKFDRNKQVNFLDIRDTAAGTR